MEISYRDLNNDIKNCFFAIYGGSTAIIKCLANGMWPIYYNYSNINVDIIHNLKVKNKFIKNNNNFKKLIAKKKYFYSNMINIKKFYKNYYYPLKINI